MSSFNKYKKMFKMFNRALKKPPGIIAFKIKQELVLKIMHKTNGWAKFERKIEDFWLDDKIKEYATKNALNPVIIARDAEKALKLAIDNGQIKQNDLEYYSSQMFNRDFYILNAKVPKKKWDWNVDWRFNYEWKNSYYKKYNFYEENKSIPYDVKYPWELSRLSFIIPVLQNTLINNDKHLLGKSMEILEDWNKHNPLAYSVNWYPMEVSMRSINLVKILDFLILIDSKSDLQFKIVLSLLSKHGEFLYKTVEYTDVRGNHYAANLVALLVIGSALKGIYPNADKWFNYAKTRIFREIKLQFFEDGVNFEKSIPYHRLVLELFLLGTVVLERQGVTISNDVKEILRNASTFTMYYQRPDGIAPNIGDNDNARVFHFDNHHVNNHKVINSLSASYFNNGIFKNKDDQMLNSIPLMLGVSGYKRWLDLEISTPEDFKYFASGGFFVAKSVENYFITDLGEVGLNGRGGHGHNDLFSFELYLNGEPIIIDPGSYMYTGDLESKELFRSTKYHNVLRVDRREIAELNGPWGIQNDALPKNVNVQELSNYNIKVSGEHTGYLRLEKTVCHRRTFSFDKDNGELTCTDEVGCSNSHLIERFLHLPPDLKIDHLENKILLTSKNGYEYLIIYNKGTKVNVNDDYVSYEYGHKVKSKTLVFKNNIVKNTTLQFKIQVKKGELL